MVPRLVETGWDTEPHSFTEQRTFTDGRIVVSGSKVHRQKQKRADYLLRHTADFPIAVVEAKADYKNPADGLQQAKEYAEILDLKFVYSTNGHGIVEFDFLTGREQELTAFPTPDELWSRLAQAKTIVFCVDQEHADEMRSELNNRNADLVREHPDYVCRVTAEEGSIGRGHLSRFQELETVSPVVATASPHFGLSAQLVCWRR